MIILYPKDFQKDTSFFSFNSEVLTGDKVLTKTDDTCQYLDPGSANRIITLPNDAATGKVFVIRHNGDYNSSYYLTTKQGATILDRIYAGTIKKFIWDGTNWVSGENGTSENDNKYKNVAAGYAANSSDEGAAVGCSADGSIKGAAVGRTADGSNYGAALGSYVTGSTYGAAVGYSAYGSTYGTALGSYADGSTYGNAVGYDAKGSSYGAALGSYAEATVYGVAIGYYANGSNYGAAIGSNATTNGKKYAFAKGYYSKAERYNEEVKSCDGANITKYSYSTLSWQVETINSTQSEIFLGGITSQRAILLPSSAFGFSLYITALNNADGKAKRWKIDGLIKRDGANNTVLVGTVTKTVIAQSDTTGGTENWDVIVSADDTNEALKIEVKGEASKTIRWIVRGEIEEVRF
jgi:hypothetical protein